MEKEQNKGKSVQSERTQNKIQERVLKKCCVCGKYINGQQGRKSKSGFCSNCRTKINNKYNRFGWKGLSKTIIMLKQKTIDEVKAKIENFEFPVFLIDESPVFLIDERGMTEEHLKEMEKSRKELLNSIEEIKFEGGEING